MFINIYCCKGNYSSTHMITVHYFVKKRSSMKGLPFFSLDPSNESLDIITS